MTPISGWRIYGCFLAVLILGGCFPYYGRTDPPIPQRPFQVVDADTGEIIPSVLVVPRYVYAWGAGTGFGEGPSTGVGSTFVADLYIHRSGAPLTVADLKTVGIMWGPGFAFTGSGQGLVGVVLAAPGYRPRWVSAKDLFAGFTEFDLTADLAGSSDGIQSLVASLSQDTIVPDQYWGGGEQPIEVRLTMQQKEIARSFLLGIPQASMKANYAVQPTRACGPRG